MKDQSSQNVEVYTNLFTLPYGCNYFESHAGCGLLLESLQKLG